MSYKKVVYKDETVEFGDIVYLQINKTRARKEFDKGTRLYVLPCNVSREGLHPHSMFPFKAAVCEKKPDNSNFNVWLDGYEYYNCNKETGTYPHFFIRIDKKEDTP